MVPLHLQTNIAMGKVCWKKREREEKKKEKKKKKNKKKKKKKIYFHRSNYIILDISLC